MTSWNLLGCCTGRSAAFLPWDARSNCRQCAKRTGPRDSLDQRGNSRPLEPPPVALAPRACCARAESGRAAAPPRSEMNSPLRWTTNPEERFGRQDMASLGISHGLQRPNLQPVQDDHGSSGSSSPVAGHGADGRFTPDSCRLAGLWPRQRGPKRTSPSPF
jgi:hypothetical protein